MSCFCSSLIINLQNQSVVSHLFTFLHLLKSEMQYHLFIANNQDWMMIWFEQCQHSGHLLKWEFVSSLAKEACCNGDFNVTQKEID